MKSFDVSVVVPVFNGMRWMQRCLDSLTNQTLSYEQFQVIFVFNGPEDGAVEYTRNYLIERPGINATIQISMATSAASARNDGIRVCRSRFLTFIDVDDCVSPNYLQCLLESSDEDVMSVAQLANINDEGHVDRKNIINQDLLRQESAKVEPAQYPRCLTFMTAKMFPTKWAKECLFDEDLRSGEDVAFYGEILSKHDFSISVLPGLQDATYFRQVVSNSVSRGKNDFEFMVKERALVIRSLSHSVSNSNAKDILILRSFMRSQASFIRKYILSNTNEYQRVADFICMLNISDFPWANIRPDCTDLAICYNFVPYSDTGANVAAKRMRQSARVYDVISHSMSNVRSSELKNRFISEPYVAKTFEIQGGASFANGNGVLSFVERGLATYTELLNAGRGYSRLYSRTMWPASHFLAAAIKSRNPKLEWTAEFSDPVRITTNGTIRSADLPVERLLELIFMKKDTDSNRLLMNNPDIFAWAELLPFLYADKITFTNKNQLEIMKSLYDQDIVDRLDSKSTVSHHPTLPRSFYELGNVGDFVIAGKTNIAYFGEFYDTRGISEIADAIIQLHASGDTRCVLHIFSSSQLSSEYNKLHGTAFVLHEKISYIDFLSCLDDFDCLVVNDASTREHHSMNPYLPSKYADYRGALSPIWSVVERGSVLSQLPSEYKTFLGDVGAAKQVLHRLSDGFLKGNSEG